MFAGPFAGLLDSLLIHSFVQLFARSGFSIFRFEGRSTARSLPFARWLDNSLNLPFDCFSSSLDFYCSGSPAHLPVLAKVRLLTQMLTLPFDLSVTTDRSSDRAWHDLDSVTPALRSGHTRWRGMSPAVRLTHPAGTERASQSGPARKCRDPRLVRDQLVFSLRLVGLGGHGGVSEKGREFGRVYEES